jgi:branched-subunit amino acid aminotransferase/4-amino-4-deoxychorismate lyase
MTRYAFFEGEIRPIEEARISVRTHAFNYGTGWFGGLRGYWNEAQGQLYVFRIYDHYKRFLQSGSLLYASACPTASTIWSRSRWNCCAGKAGARIATSAPWATRPMN